MTTQINLAEIRNENSKAPQFSAFGTHEAMIVKTWYTKRKYTVGVQYWTKEQVANGVNINNDGTRSELIAQLYC